MRWKSVPADKSHRTVYDLGDAACRAGVGNCPYLPGRGSGSWRNAWMAGWNDARLELETAPLLSRLFPESERKL